MPSRRRKGSIAASREAGLSFVVFDWSQRAAHSAGRMAPESQGMIPESTAKRAGHRCGAAFAEADSRASHAHACFAMHPSWFVFRVLCAPGVSAVRFAAKSSLAFDGER